MNISYVYILTNKANTLFYIGISGNIKTRFFQHRKHLIKGFTDKYNITKVIYIESFNSIIEAIEREKQLKGWKREKKIELIKTLNPNLKDLYEDIMNC